MAARRTARDLIDLIVDDGTFRGWDTPPSYPDLPPSYADELAAARERTGADEAVLTGEAIIGGHRVAVAASEFGFLAGSIGRATADRLIAAIERATAEGLPLLAAPSSGGTRMQEGTRAFVQMIRVAAAVSAHKAAGLPYLVYLRNPTTGGVLASWGSLAHVTVAEPGALIGFLGPRVYEALYGEAFPPDVQTAENLAAHGLIDGVLPAEHVRDVLLPTLRVLRSRPASAEILATTGRATPVDAWEAIERTRRPGRPGVRELLAYAATEVVTLSGTGQGERDPALLLALARFGGVPAVVLGQVRGDPGRPRELGPAGLRAARRGARLAEELRLPLLTIIDTHGAALSVEAEQGGLSGEIARSLEDLVTLDAPSVSVLLGEGTGGGALALLPADRVIAAQHSWLAPLPPEGASAIVHRDPSHAAEMARAQGVGAFSLRDAGIVDEIAAETPDAADEPEAFCRRLGSMIAAGLVAATALSPEGRTARRAARFTR